MNRVITKPENRSRAERYHAHEMVPREPVAGKLVPDEVVIGGVRIAPATILAPMAGVTDTVFRRFIKHSSFDPQSSEANSACGLIMTEFTSADGLFRTRESKRKRYLHFYEDEHPISAQLFGSDPVTLSGAAKIVEDCGFDLVDLNLGCPAKKVVKCNGGSGLLRDLPHIKTIFEAVRGAVKIPFTVKFRMGWDDTEIVCVELAKLAENCGLNAVALHARTREQGYSGNARWEWIAAIKDAVKIPVIGNGDIRSPEDACAMVNQTGCDAVMIGRSAPSNPWIFRQIEQYCAARITNAHVGTAAPGCQVEQSSTGFDFGNEVEGQESALRADGQPRAAVPTSGSLYDQPSESDRYQMIRTYFQMLIEEELPDAIGKMKQFASWFTHGVPGGAGLRKAIYESKSAPEVLGRVEDFFEARLCGAMAFTSESNRS